MKLGPSREDLAWVTAGAFLLFVIAIVVLQFRPVDDRAERLASRTRRIHLVEQMRLALASAAEAEKSAVLAITDEESTTFADEARASTARVQGQRNELAVLLQRDGTEQERDLLVNFTAALAEFQKVDAELLSLAVKNTNLKAYDLAFGPSAEALQRMDSALSEVVAGSAEKPDGREIARLAFRAQSAALRIQAMLAPHIAEESDRKMDVLEGRMKAEDDEVRRDLAALAAMPALAGDADLATATASFVRCSELRRQILGLSRENTDVRSLAISLTVKRKVTLRCQEALTSLQQAIAEEPGSGVERAAASSPR